jgi:hypothetical protein
VSPCTLSCKITEHSCWWHKDHPLPLIMIDAIMRPSWLIPVPVGRTLMLPSTLVITDPFRYLLLFSKSIAKETLRELLKML